MTCPVHEIFVGERAFYKQPNYTQTTRQELQNKATLPAIYQWESQNRFMRLSQRILSVIVFPIGIYKIIHYLAGKIIVPASSPSMIGYRKDYAHQLRSEFQPDDVWKYKRIALKVDDSVVDAVVMGTAQTFENGRWMLVSHGNGQYYEQNLVTSTSDAKSLASSLSANMILFNYPGVGDSPGPVSREQMQKTYRAFLHFLEDKQKGIGAKEIIGYGHSIGGGVQGEALFKHQPKEHIKYVFVKSRTFSTLHATACALKGKILGHLVRIFGWNIQSSPSSQGQRMNEIILQTARVSEYKLIEDSQLILNDGVIPASCSLGKKVLDTPSHLRSNKIVIGIPDRHNHSLSDIPFLAQQIENLLNTQPLL